MSGAPKPPVIPEPFANDADPLFITAIPDTTGVAGRASYSLGFPPLTMQPIAGGGKPPFGQDMNGILFALSSHDFYVQAGQLFLWDTTVAAAIGGYGIGTLLGSTDGKTVWFNTTNANSTNPDAVDGSAAGWVSLFSSGFQPFTGLTGGTLTPNPTQAARKVITLSGVLTSNLAVVMPNWTAPAGRWLFINNTTGAFVTTVRTAAGTGVTLPQGGPGSPLEVYGDGTNIYPAVSPLSIPISQSADPLTLAERDNLGRVQATNFVTSGVTTNFGVVNCYYGNGDGTIYPITKADFQASMALPAFAGQVSAAQVPLAAVLQYAANILASAVLTGTPTAPTAALGTSNTQVATTAFANPGVTTNANGTAIRLPSGHLFQFGTKATAWVTNPVDAAVTFPVPFNTGVLAAFSSSLRSVAGNGQAIDGSGFTSNWTVNGMTITVDSVTGTWWAIGI